MFDSRSRIGMGILVAWALLGAGLARAQEGRENGSVIQARAVSDEVLTLEQCVRLALSGNDQLQAERLRSEELKGKMKQALSTGLPTVDLVGDWSRSRNPSIALDESFGGGGGAFAPPVGSPAWFTEWLGGFGSLIPAAQDIPSQDFWRTNLNLAWNINPAKILGATGAVRLGLDRQRLNEQNQELLTTEQTMTAYFNILKAAEKIQAVEARLANQDELLGIVRLQFQLGIATRLDTLQAAVSLANVRPQLDIARANLRNQGARLNALMGRSPERPLAVANQQTVELDPLQDDTVVALAQQRPDLKAVDVLTDILRRNRQAQKSENLPYLTISGSYGYVGKKVDDLFVAGHDAWSTAVALNIPVFDGLLNRGLVAETEASIRRTEAEQTGNRRLVQVEALELLANLRLARGVLSAALLNQRSSEEVLDESLLQLELGKTTYLDVLLAEANRAEARSNVIDARHDVLVLTASLKRAMGYSPLISLTQIPGLVAEVSP